MENGTPSQALDVIRGDLEAITQANQRDSPFLRLPAELRNRIYEAGCLRSTILVRSQLITNRLDKPSPHSAKHRSSLGLVHAAKHRSSLSLVHVCRQIRHEAMSTFLHHTRFDLRVQYSQHGQKTDWSLRKIARSIVIDGCVAAMISSDYHRHKERLEQDTDMLAFSGVELPCLERVFVLLCCMEFRTVDMQNGFQEVARSAFGCNSPQVHLL